MRAIRFTILSLAAVLGIMYLVFVVAIYFNQESVIFHASKLPATFEFEFDEPFEELMIPSSDGVKLHGLLFKTPKPKGLVFYLHGNAGTLEQWSRIAPDYTALGYDVFLLDYRGYGMSEGSIDSEDQFLTDVSAAYERLQRRYQNIVIVGYSIGTGPSAYLASKYRTSALVLQAPYYNLVELAGLRVPLVPEFLLKYRFETNLYLPKVTCPIYIFHGTDDKLIQFDHGERLHKLMEGKSELFPLSGVGHGGINQDERFLSQMKVILEKASNTQQ